MEINSKDYWDNRFKFNDWILEGGDNQNKYFYNLMIEMMPINIKNEILNKSMSICDFGCAEGDGLKVFKEEFKYSDITGIDISDYALAKARKKYTNIIFVNKIEKKYDVIISSNTLEHFTNPYQVLENLFDYANKYVILLLPFKEYKRIDEHFYTFDFDNILLNYNDFTLLHLNWINSDKLYWNGKQIILIYTKNPKVEEIIKANLTTLTSKYDYIEYLYKKIINKDLLIEEKQSELMKISDWAAELNQQVKDKDLLLEEKQSELMKISDWAAELNQQAKDKDLLLEEKQSELIKISDWATQLKQRIIELEKEISRIKK